MHKFNYKLRFNCCSPSSSSSIITAVLLILVVLNININIVNSQLVLPIDPKEVPSIKWIMYNYRLAYWSVTQNASSDIPILSVPWNDVTVINFTASYFNLASINIVDKPLEAPFADYYISADTDLGLTELDFPYLHTLSITSAPNLGNASIFEMLKSLPLLEYLKISNHYTHSIPYEFPYSSKYLSTLKVNGLTMIPRNLNNEFYPNLNTFTIIGADSIDLPDGFGLGSSKLIFKLYDFGTPLMRLNTRLPDSLCDIKDFSGSFNISSYGMKYGYVSDCFKCFNGHLSPISTFNDGVPYPSHPGCNITITKMRYEHEKVTIYGNSLFYGVVGYSQAIVPNQVLLYDKQHPSTIEEDFIIGNDPNRGVEYKIKLSFTLINVDGVATISQVPFGVSIYLPSNYYYTNPHVVSADGSVCRKFTVDTTDRSVSCIVPLTPLQSKSILITVSNLQYNEQIYSPFIKEYPIVNNNITIISNIIYQEDQQNYTITGGQEGYDTTTGGSSNNNSSSSSSSSNSGSYGSLVHLSITGNFGKFKPIQSLVQINGYQCNITSVGSDRINCSIDLSQFQTIINNLNNSIENGGEEGEYLELYIEIDGHSYTSNNMVYFTLKTSKLSIPTQVPKQSYSVIIAVSLVCAAILVSVIIYGIYRYRNRRSRSSNFTHHNSSSRNRHQNGDDMGIRLTRRKYGHEHNL